MNVIAVCDSSGIVVNVDNTISCVSGWSLPPEPLYGALEVFNMSNADLVTLMGASMIYFVGCFASKLVWRSVWSAGHSDLKS